MDIFQTKRGRKAFYCRTFSRNFSRNGSKFFSEYYYPFSLLQADIETLKGQCQRLQAEKENNDKQQV